MRQSVMWKDWFAIFKVKVMVMAYIVRMRLSTICSELLILLQPDLVWWYIIIRWNVLWEDRTAVFSKGSKLHWMFVWMIFSESKVCIVTHHDEPECQAERLICYMYRIGMVVHYHELEHRAKLPLCCQQGQGHSEGSYIQNMPVSTESTKLLILLQSSSVKLYIIINQNIFWKYWIII